MANINNSRREVQTALNHSIIVDILPDLPKPLAEMSPQDIANYQDAILEMVADITKVATQAVESLEGLAWDMTH